MLTSGPAQQEIQTMVGRQTILLIERYWMTSSLSPLKMSETQQGISSAVDQFSYCFSKSLYPFSGGTSTLFENLLT